MTRDEWAKFDGRVVVVERWGTVRCVGRYRHDECVLDPCSEWFAEGQVARLVAWRGHPGNCASDTMSLWRPEVGETVRVVGPDLRIVVTSYTGESVAGEFVPGDYWSVDLEDVEPVWFPKPEAAAAEPTTPTPPPIEAPQGWELVDAHWAWCDGEPEGYRTIRKGESVREERLELRGGEWHMVVSDPATRVIGPDAPTRGRSVFADAAEELSKRLAVGLGVPSELVEQMRPQPFATSWIDPVKDANSTTIRIDSPMLADKDYVRREILPAIEEGIKRFDSMSVPLRREPPLAQHDRDDLEASDPPPFPRPLVQSCEQVEQRTQAEAGFRAALRRWRVVHGLVPEERVPWWVRLWRWVRGR